MQPAIGMTVTYYELQDDTVTIVPRAAMVSEIGAGLTLFIFGGSSIYLDENVSFSPEPLARHWNWLS